MCMMNYDEEVLTQIKEWDVINKAKELATYLKSIWAWDDYIKIKGKRIWKVEIHTGGWSEHETIINILPDMFWAMYFKKELVGGHYYFRVYTPKQARRSTKDKPYFWNPERLNILREVFLTATSLEDAAVKIRAKGIPCTATSISTIANKPENRFIRPLMNKKGAGRKSRYVK
jgi:hypothetical protein